MLRVAILGATGRMGQTLVRLVAADPQLRLAGTLTEPGDAALGEDAGSAAGIQKRSYHDDQATDAGSDRARAIFHARGSQRQQSIAP